MTTRESTMTKLDPAHMKVSGKFTAILGFLFGEPWTSPAIIEMVQTVDGFLLAATTEDPMMNDFVGAAEDLDRNLRGVSDAADLTRQERAYLLLLRTTKIRRA